MSTQVPIPLDDAFTRPKRQKFGQGRDPQEGKLTDPAIAYLTSQSQVVSTVPTRVGEAVELTVQGASIGATDFSGGNLGAGLYLIEYYAQITRAAGTSSSLTVNFDWTYNGVAQTDTGGAITGNTTATHQADRQFLIYSDATSPIRYSTTYASAGAPTMLYALFAVLQKIRA